MAKVPPAFQFYANDFVTGTSRLTLAEVGAYILLLCEQWDKGSVPGDDMKAIAQVLRGSPQAAKIWARISNKFTRGDDGQWRNDRLEVVRRQQLEYRSKQAANGHNGGRPLKPTHNPTVLDSKTQTKPTSKAKHNPNKSTPTPVFSLQSSEHDQTKERFDRSDTRHASAFDRFWEAYPKRKAKPDALKAWHALDPDEALVETILAAIETQRRSTDWIKNKGQFIPYPASWLRGRRWEDEPVELPQVSEKTARSMEAIRGTH